MRTVFREEVVQEDRDKIENIDFLIFNDVLITFFNNLNAALNVTRRPAKAREVLKGERLAFLVSPEFLEAGRALREGIEAQSRNDPMREEFEREVVQFRTLVGALRNQLTLVFKHRDAVPSTLRQTEAQPSLDRLRRRMEQLAHRITIALRRSADLISAREIHANFPEAINLDWLIRHMRSLV